MTGSRDERIAALDARIAALRADFRAELKPLLAERDALLVERNRELYPDGPFTLHWLRGWKEPESDEFDDPMEALHAARRIEVHDDGSTDSVTDRHGKVIYDLTGTWPKRVAEGYPDPPRYQLMESG